MIKEVRQKLKNLKLLKLILLVCFALLFVGAMSGCGGRSLRDGRYEFHRSDWPREEWSATANVWMNMIENAGGVIIDGNRIASNGSTFYYFMIGDNNVIYYRRRETQNWSSGPYRFRNGTIVLEFNHRGETRQIWLRRTGRA